MAAARDAEDTALALISTRSAVLERVRIRREHAVAEHNAEVESAETELANAIDALVDAAGFERAALVLGMPSAALRKVLPPTKPKTAAPTRPKPAVATGGQR
jgi:hypothetical protein